MSTATERKISVRPLGNRVVIKRDAAPTHSQAGIDLSAAEQTIQQLGTVIAVGPGKPWTDATTEFECCDPEDPRFPMSVELGDRVVLGLYAAAPLELDGEEFSIISEDDILAVLDKV